MIENSLLLVAGVIYVIPATVLAYARLTAARAILVRAQADAECIRQSCLPAK